MYGAGLRLLRFFFLNRISLAVLLREQLLQILRRLTGNILHGNALADFGGVVRMAQMNSSRSLSFSLISVSFFLYPLLVLPATTNKGSAAFLAFNQRGQCSISYWDTFAKNKS